MKRKNYLSLIMLWLVSTVVGCMMISQNTQVSPTPTKVEVMKTNIPTVQITFTPISPLVLFQSSTMFTVAPDNISNATAIFDFDTNKMSAPDEENENDIEFNVSEGTNTFITVLPMNKSRSYSLKKFAEPMEEFSYNDCSSSTSKFKSGSRQIHLGQVFCWETSKGNMVEFLIEEINKKDKSFDIRISYIVWEASSK